MIRKRLLWLFVLQILLVLLVSGLYLQYKLRTTLEKELGSRLESLAAVIAGQTDGALIRLLSPGDEGGRVHKRLQSHLAGLAQAGQLSRVVLFDPSGRIWLDSQNRAAIAEPYSRFEFDRPEIAATLGNHNNQSPLFTGHDGLLYKSAYAPLRADGAVIGVVAVEGSAASLNRVREMQATLLQIGALSLLLAIGLSWFTSQRLTQPLQQLRRSAERLSRGEWRESIAVSGEDEIAFLARTMEEMRKNNLQRVEQQKAMMAGVAHELRNPIGGIELFAGLIRDEAADADSRQRAGRILKESRNLQTLVQNFLDYARPITSRPQSCRVSAGWQEAVDLLQNEINAKQVQVVRTGDGRVWADPQHLRQMLINLLLNAVQSIDRQDGRVELRIAQEAGVCTLEVSDNGRGIAKEQWEKIFQPFFSNREKGL
ncbi:HAMP domain-containing histidine kinase, partial [bacterium]|nr:HAMP domain-containing histidine kinase [bacterium]